MSTPYNPAPDPELLPPGPPPVEPAVPAPVENPPWTFREVIFLAFIAIFLIAFCQGIAISLARHKYPQTPIGEFARNPRVILPPQLIAYLALLGAMILMVRSRGVHFWRSVRWNWPGSKWIGFILLGLMLAIIVQLASGLLPIPKQLPIEQFFSDTTSAYMLALFGVTLAPLMEELYFRGFLYPVLARRIGIPASVTITALSFALIHASQLAHAWGPLLLLFLVGLALTIARVRTSSVATSFLMHAGYNGTLFTAMYFASDHFRNLERLK